MRIYFTLLLFFCVLHIVKAQDTLYQIDFIYNLNNKISYSGTSIKYDKYNFPTEKNPIQLDYKIIKEENNKDSRLYQLQYRQILGNKDSIKADNTTLEISKKGLSVSLKENTNYYKKDKHDYLGIKLPLFKGLEWETYMNDAISQATCISMDTVIPTIYGDLHTYAVFTKTEIIDNKELSSFIEITEYFSSKIGKVKMLIDTYVIFKENNRKVYLTKEIYDIKETSLSNEIIKTLKYR